MSYSARELIRQRNGGHDPVYHCDYCGVTVDPWTPPEEPCSACKGTHIVCDECFKEFKGSRPYFKRLIRDAKLTRCPTTEQKVAARLVE